ncbi:NAD(P)/FAD-dependent oxidoreductase [Sphingomonas sp.]|uniref:flavin monoamine oxidase family protein n=1 Tax=Sphingomonas sp. TaxID=28214 RepID=UPI0025CBEB24|nr:NAD(P)/FAD-dependent oxidoreductase [Sphingomonas sp.]MBV9528489.1 FAD-dependent oxidoreductase [Sphingomonas sp.]
MERRTFLKTVAAGLGASMMPSGAKAVDQSRSAGAAGKRVIVAGAGITGLCCAYELMQHGVDVVVLEASGRYGGHVFTGHDGLSDGLFADYGADHLTKPGYEQFFRYVDAFGLEAVPYPNAEGSPLPANNGQLTQIGEKFYSDAMLGQPATLRALGFNDKEVVFLSSHPWYELPSLYLADDIARFHDASQPFGNGLDAYDVIDLDTLFARRGASKRARDYLAGQHQNALYGVWRYAVMKDRGIPLSEGETFHLKGGNEEMPKAFAARLGTRVRLNHPITAITHDASGVTVTHTAYGSDTLRTMHADYLVNCISLPVFRKIQITPGLSPAKRYVVDNVAYSSHPFFVFEAESKFWLEDGFTNLAMSFEHPDIQSIWVVPESPASTRVILKAFGPSGLSPQRVLAAFREVYPGKRDTIVQALTYDWSQDPFAPTCEMEPFAPGTLRKFWPEIMKPDGRLYFAGTYADPLSRGMESCVRSAARVAREIADA